MGILDNYLSGGQLSSDPAKNDALDQMLWALGGSLVGGRGPAGPTIHNAIQNAMGVYQGAMEGAQKKRLTDAQIADMISQGKLRDAQASAAILKAQHDAAILAARNDIYQPGRVNTQGQRAGMPLPAGFDFKQSSIAQNAGIPQPAPTVPNAPTLADIARLQGLGADTGGDLALYKAGQPTGYAPGTTLISPDGARDTLPTLAPGTRLNTAGQIELIPGALSTQSQSTLAQEGAKAVAGSIAQDKPVLGPNGEPGTVNRFEDLRNRGLINPDGSINLTGAMDRAQRAALPPQQPGAAPGQQPGAFSQTGLSKNVEHNLAARSERFKELNTNFDTKVMTPLREAASKAADNQMVIDLMGGINLKTGWGAETKAKVMAVFTGLGMGTPAMQDIVAKSQSFQSLISSAVLQEQLKQAGIQTESDAKRMQSVYTSITNTEEANRFIMAYMTALNRAVTNKARFYSDSYSAMNSAYANDREARPFDPNVISSKWMSKPYPIWDDPALAPWKGRKG